MRSGSTWNVSLVVGAPSTNAEPIRFKACIYMRDDASASQTATWKANERCTPEIALNPGQGWQSTGATPWYTLPSHASNNRYLRSYVVVRPSDASLYIDRWEVRRNGNP